ncbi:hypothetical protein GCM10027447_11640 [Glycomyces halotolerans]
MYNQHQTRQPGGRPGNGMNWKHWLAIGIVAVLCCGGLVAANSNFSNPTGTIQSNYQRASNLDEGNGRAYTSASPPSIVADRIEDEAEPVDERSSGGSYYLQYTKHIVEVSPYRGGSKILLDGYRDGYQRHSSIFILWGWSSSPPSPFRGGGPGSGK